MRQSKQLSYLKAFEPEVWKLYGSHLEGSLGECSILGQLYELYRAYRDFLMTKYRNCEAFIKRHSAEMTEFTY